MSKGQNGRNTAYARKLIAIRSGFDCMFLRWPYHAKVMKIFDRKSSETVVIGSLPERNGPRSPAPSTHPPRPQPGGGNRTASRKANARKRMYENILRATSDTDHAGSPGARRGAVANCTGCGTPRGVDCPRPRNAGQARRTRTAECRSGAAHPHRGGQRLVDGDLTEPEPEDVGGVPLDQAHPGAGQDTEGRQLGDGAAFGVAVKSVIVGDGNFSHCKCSFPVG